MSGGRLAPQAQAGAARAVGLAAVLGARVHASVLVPRTDIKGAMRLCDRAESLSITVEARAFFAAQRLPIDPTALSSPGVMNEWNCEVAVRHLAIAVRDPSDTTKALAPLEDWRSCDDEQITSLWQEYQDLRERLDPLRSVEQLTDAELAAITSAAKKKESELLMSFGSRRLAAYAISTAVPPAS